MKKRIITYVLALLATTAICQTTDSLHLSFKFPFSQGDAKWKEFKTPQDRIAALQIPKNILAKISTEDLLLICLDFPYMSDVFAYDDIANGVRAVASKFNGFKEFLTRQDQTEAMINVFQRISHDNLYLIGNSDIEIGNNSMRISILSYLLGRNEIQNKMKSSLKTNLLDITKNTINTISQYSYFTPSLGYFALHTLKQILSDSPQREIYGDYMSVTRYTPNDSPVLAWKLYQNELSEIEKTYYAYLAVNNYGATIISEATKKYNCHAYAWHMTEGGDSVWIGLNSIYDENIYWEDSSYMEVPEPLASKVSYYEILNANHSAIILSSGLYRSKWGAWPLVEHTPNACPYDTSLPKKYYARTPYLSGLSFIKHSEDYCINNISNSMSIIWSTDNDAFSISSLGNQCKVTYEGVNHYDTTILTAVISYDGQILKTLRKEIYHIDDIVGESVLCNQEYYSVDNLPNNFSIEWSIDNISFTISPLGNNCSVSCNSYNADRAATLTASIYRNGTFFYSLSKRIFTHGNSLAISGRQEEYVSTSGYYPAQTFSYSETYATTGFVSDTININGDCDIDIESTRFKGMNISFEGDYLPSDISHFNEYCLRFHTSECPTEIPFLNMQGTVPRIFPRFRAPYNLRLKARSDVGCSDFDIIFRVLPFPYINDPELQITTNNYYLYAYLTNATPTPIGNGMYQQPTWSLTVTKVSTGQQMVSKTVMGIGTSVNISNYSSGLYAVTAIFNGLTYSAKFVKQ